MQDMTSITCAASPDLPQATASIVAAARISAQASGEIPFSQKLMNMINDGRFRGVVGWSADGESFSILKRDIFKSRVLPAYFGHIQLKSFKKRLSRHGFETRQIYTLGREDTAFFHPNFIRDRPELCVLIVPLGTKKMTKKRSREEIENQPSEKQSSSFSLLSSNDNFLRVNQPLSPPSITVKTAPVEIQLQGQGQRGAGTKDASVAAALFCASGHATAEVTITDKQTWNEPAAKKICETPGVTSQEVSMGAQVEDAERDDTTTRSDAVVHSERAVPPQDQNEEVHRNHTLIGRDPAALTAHPQDGTFPEIDTPPHILSSCPDVSRTSQSSGDEQGAESGIDDAGSLRSEDGCGLAQTGRVEEEQRKECRDGNTSQNADVCSGICPKDVGQPPLEASSAQQVLSHDHGRDPLHSTHPSSTSVNAAILRAVQQQWFQSELQAAAMSAQAAFLRKLFLQTSGTQGAAGILRGAFGSSCQLGSMELLHQQLQPALGSVGSEQCFLNGLRQQAVHWSGLLVFPDGSQQHQAGQSFNPQHETPSLQNVNTGGQMSSAQDPVADILYLASFPGVKFSS